MDRFSNRFSDTPPDCVPSGPLEQKWTKHKADSKLINPANKRKFTLLVVGSGHPRSAAAAATKGSKAEPRSRRASAVRSKRDSTPSRPPTKARMAPVRVSRVTAANWT